VVAERRLGLCFHFPGVAGEIAVLTPVYPSCGRAIAGATADRRHHGDRA
jgi:hypothetical protein